MMPPLYQIVDFPATYQHYRSEKIDNCSWFKQPTDFDIQWANLMSQGLPGAAAYGIFQSLLKLCARQRKPRLGFLTHDGKADGRRYTLAELAMITYQTEELVEQAFKFLLSPEVNWLRVTPSAPHGDTAVTPSAPHGDTAVTPSAPHGVTLEVPIGDIGDIGEEREKKGSLDSKSSTEADPIQHTEAKQLLAKLSEDVFNTPLRENQWSQKWDYALSQALPMSHEDWAVIDRFYRLAPTHQIFAVTRKRHSMGALIENLMDEPMKIRSAWAAIGRNGALPKAKPSELERVPVEWARVMKKKYGADIPVPAYKKDIAPSVCAELEACVANEAKTA